MICPNDLLHSSPALHFKISKTLLNYFLKFNFEHVHPVVFILMYWIYLLPSTQQTIGYNGFKTCFDSHKSSSGYVQNPSVLAVLLPPEQKTVSNNTAKTKRF
jgi:hypothetical protein